MPIGADADEVFQMRGSPNWEVFRRRGMGGGAASSGAAREWQRELLPGAYECTGRALTSRVARGRRRQRRAVRVRRARDARAAGE